MWNENGGMGMEGMGNGNPRSVEVLIYPPRGNEITTRKTGLDITD